MKFALAKVTEVTALPRHRLALRFADGVEGVVDCRDLLWGEALAPLKEPAVFEKVYIDHGAPTWPNGADLDPAVLRQAVAKEKLATKRRSSDKSLVHEEAAPYFTETTRSSSAPTKSSSRSPSATSSTSSSPTSSRKRKFRAAGPELTPAARGVAARARRA